MRYLVTGGAGFIGSWLVETLINQGHDVTVIDDLSTGCADNIHPAAEVFRTDCGILQAGRLWNDFTFDGVFHLASTVGVANVYKDPARSAWNIVNAACQVNEWLESRPKPPRVVLASSSEIYGNAMGILPEWLEARIPSGPRWAYAAAKKTTESMIPGAIIARIFNTIGPRQRPDFGMVVPRFMEAAMQGKPIHIYRRSGSRSFACVHDTVAGLIALMEHGTEGEIYNVGAYNPTPMDALAHEVKRACASSSPIQTVDAPYPNYTDIAERRPNLKKLMDLGWRQSWTLPRTLDLTYEHLKSLTPEICLKV